MMLLVRLVGGLVGLVVYRRWAKQRDQVWHRRIHGDDIESRYEQHVRDSGEPWLPPTSTVGKVTFK